MIVYNASKQDFLRHALDSDIEKVILSQMKASLGKSASSSEVNSWKNSLTEMAKVMRDVEIPDDSRIGIEYELPQSRKRIDFIISGLDKSRNPRLVIVELKQWSTSTHTDKDAIIIARRGGPRGETEGTHPCYQAWSYAAYLKDFNAAVQDSSIELQPCAYLHNHPRDGEIDHPNYRSHIELAPLFLDGEREKLKLFIKEHVRYGDNKNSLYTIEHGRIRPSKQLASSVESMLAGSPEFTLLDDQKLVYESALAADSEAQKHKQVVIVKGGPGTGKSVVAINLLSKLLRREKNARYVSKNAAPRAVYQAKLTGTITKTRFSNLFSGSGAFVDAAQNTFDTLIVDEAHRLNEKSGRYGNLGENQIKEIINAAKCSIFFVDDDQQVTLKDIGDSESLRLHAAHVGAAVTELELTSQFRCNGSDGYLAWLDNSLAIRETANTYLDTIDYDFRVFDDPNELHKTIATLNKSNNRSRVVAGYCWKWPSKKDPNAWDINLTKFNYQRRWNLTQDGSLWITAEKSIDEVGCIHTCQGLELDYVGVIIGPDIIYQDEVLITDATKRATSDQSVKGIKKMLREDPVRAEQLANKIIKNTYRTLMTRGMKGCFIHCTDAALNQYFRDRLNSKKMESTPIFADPTSLNSTTTGDKVIPLRRLTRSDRRQDIPDAPLIDLKFAAGSFSEAQSLDEQSVEWVALPAGTRPNKDHFVAQVVGESMNRRIPNGSWCLFKARPMGTRLGKVVVVQHRQIADVETGGSFTIKVYSSEKQMTESGDVQHTSIVLSPDSIDPSFQPIVLTIDDADEDLQVVAELVTVFQGTRA